MTSKVNRYIFHKIVCAVRDLPRTFRRLPTPRLIMTLLVKNEEELLEKNLLFHKAMGVDAFIVTIRQTEPTELSKSTVGKDGWWT